MTDPRTQGLLRWDQWLEGARLGGIRIYADGELEELGSEGAELG